MGYAHTGVRIHSFLQVGVDYEARIIGFKGRSLQLRQAA
jgi:hypothetical protein